MDESRGSGSNPPFKDDCLSRQVSHSNTEMLRRICPDGQAEAGEFESDHKETMKSDQSAGEGSGNDGTSRCGCCGRSEFCLRLRDAARSPLTMPMLGAFLVFWLCTVSNSSFIVGAASNIFPNRTDYEAWREFAYQVLQSYLTVHMLIALPHRLLYAFRLYRWTPADVASLRRNLTAGAKRMQLLKEGLAKTRKRKARQGDSRGVGLKSEEKGGKGAAPAVPVSRSASLSLLSPTAVPLLVLRPHERVHMSAVVALLLVNAAAQGPLFLYMVLQPPAHRSWAVVGALLSTAVAALVLASAYATFSPLGRRLQAIPRRRSVEARADGEGSGGEWRMAATACAGDASKVGDGGTGPSGRSSGAGDPAAAAGSAHAHIPTLTGGSDMDDAVSGSVGMSSAVSIVESGRLASVSAPLPGKGHGAHTSHLPAHAHAHAPSLAHAAKHSNSGRGIPTGSKAGKAVWRSGELTLQRACLLPAHVNPALSSLSSSSDLPHSLSLTLTSATAAETTAAVIAAVSPYQPRYAHTRSQPHVPQGAQGSLPVQGKRKQGAALPVVRCGSERYEQEVEKRRQEVETERREAEEEEHSRVLSLATAEEDDEDDDDELPVSQHISTLPPKLAMWQPPTPLQQASLLGRTAGGEKTGTGSTGNCEAGEGEGEGEGQVQRPVQVGGRLEAAEVGGPQWVGSLWDCCSDPSLALQALACFFCTHGRHVSGLGFGNAVAHSAQFALFLLAPTAVCVPSARFIPVPGPQFLLVGLGLAASVVSFVAYGGYFRWRMRRTFSLPPSPFLCVRHKALTDVLSWLLCPCASLCQEVRTAQEHHLHVITVVPSSWDVPAGAASAAAAAGVTSSGGACGGVQPAPSVRGAMEKGSLGLQDAPVLRAPRVEEMSDDKENVSSKSQQT